MSGITTSKDENISNVDGSDEMKKEMSKASQKQSKKIGMNILDGISIYLFPISFAIFITSKSSLVTNISQIS